MEIKIYNPQEDGFLQKIEWNFEELKAEITEKVHEYEMSVYTDDSIKAMKADRAMLNRLITAMEGERTHVRKQLLKPDERFGKEVKELVAIVEKAVKNIDSQVKDYEERQRKDKTKKIKEFYEENINDMAEYLPFDRVMKPAYANASTTMKSIKEEILAMIQKVSEGIAILNEVDSKFSGDMKEVFLRTYDIGQAMAERNRLEAAEEKRRLYEEDQARRKAEREARARADAERVMVASVEPARKAPPVQAQKVQKTPVLETEQIETVEDPVNVIDFRVYATMKQLMALKGFLNQNGIRFEPVPKQ